MSEMQNDSAGTVAGWVDFTERLEAHLGLMTDEDDHLVLETPEAPGDSGSPYIQVCGLGDGALRMEISGNRVLDPKYRLTPAQLRALEEGQGWRLPEPDDACPNLWLHLDVDAAEIFASMAAEVFEDYFHVPAPGLLTYDAWGPASDAADAIGLVPTKGVPVDVVDQVAPPAKWAEVPEDRDHLVAMVREALARHLGEEPTVDDDGDFVLQHADRPVWVAVRSDQPVIEIFSRLVEGVRSRRQAAVEANLLNRDRPIAKFIVHDRSVFIHMSLPAAPFAPYHLTEMLPFFTNLRDAVVDDLAFRTQGRK